MTLHPITSLQIEIFQFGCVYGETFQTLCTMETNVPQIVTRKPKLRCVDSKFVGLKSFELSCSCKHIMNPSTIVWRVIVHRKVLEFWEIHSYITFIWDVLHEKYFD